MTGQMSDRDFGDEIDMDEISAEMEMPADLWIARMLA